MNRRDLFSFLPWAPYLAGAAIVKEAQASERPQDNKQLLTLALNNKNLYMSVGRDGNLWLRSATGDWKRVVTE